MLNMLGNLGQLATSAQTGMAGMYPQQMQQPMQSPQMAQPRAPMQPRKAGWRDFLGLIGDTLLGFRGMQPVYAPMAMQRQRGESIGNYLGQLGADPSLMELAAIDPSLAVQFYQASKPKDPEEIDLMRRVGIDPTSPEGREIIRSKLMGRGEQNPNFVRELEALGIDPRSDEARELYYGRNSPAGYLLRPKGRAEGPAPSSAPPEGAIAHLKSNPDLAAQFDEKYGRGAAARVLGGPTASPSGGFPASGY